MLTIGRCFKGTRRPAAVYIPPQVGKALTISAMLAPSAKHVHEPISQHHVTDAGPPRSKGVLKVVATLEQTPL